jgi:hypothetical protein
MTHQRSHMTGCQAIRTQRILTELLNTKEAIANSVPADLYAPILDGLNFIQGWLNQSRSERQDGRNKCTEHDHRCIVTYHAVENGWQITYDLTRLEITHSDSGVLEKTKQLLRDGNLSPYMDTIIVCCCITR